jgi:NAD(P)-dependent dehydrogenase (short-subunit alcohol dehydrogenase family)
VKNILILGGTGSIGKYVVNELDNKKNHLIILSLGDKFISSSRRTYYKFDLSETHNVQNFIKNIFHNHGFVENFVNCAGTINRENLLTENFLEFQKIFNINFASPMIIMRELVRKMKTKRKGNFINISSQMSKIPHPNAGPSYEISKSALVTLSRHIAYNYAKYNIRSNIISPGTIKSKMQISMKRVALNNLKKNIPLKRFGKPEEVAKLVKFLLSEDSSYITGADIKLSGGSILD